MKKKRKNTKWKTNGETRLATLHNINNSKASFMNEINFSRKEGLCLIYPEFNWWKIIAQIINCKIQYITLKFWIFSAIVIRTVSMLRSFNFKLSSVRVRHKTRYFPSMDYEAHDWVLLTVFGQVLLTVLGIITMFRAGMF